MRVLVSVQAFLSIEDVIAKLAHIPYAVLGDVPQAPRVRLESVLASWTLPGLDPRLNWPQNAVVVTDTTVVTFRCRHLERVVT